MYTPFAVHPQYYSSAVARLVPLPAAIPSSDETCIVDQTGVQCYAVATLSQYVRDYSRAFWKQKCVIRPCGQSNCWSLRCSWSIACRRCSNYIFILNLIHSFSRLGKDTCKTRRETCKFWDLVRLIFEIWRYSISISTMSLSTAKPPRRNIHMIPRKQCEANLIMTSSNGNISCVTGHLCGELTGPRWIPRTKASDAELWCFLWSAPE